MVQCQQGMSKNLLVYLIGGSPIQNLLLQKATVQLQKGLISSTNGSYMTKFRLFIAFCIFDCLIVWLTLLKQCLPF